MTATPASVACERVRAQVSLELDGELSQLERRMLTSHVSRCSECSAFVEDARWFTDQIRRAPLEALARAVVVERTRRLSFVRYHVGVAAAVAVAALGLGAQLAAGPSQELSGSAAGAPHFQTRVDLDRELAIIEQLDVRTPNSAGGVAVL